MKEKEESTSSQNNDNTSGNQLLKFWFMLLHSLTMIFLSLAKLVFLNKDGLDFLKNTGLYLHRHREQNSEGRRQLTNFVNFGIQTLEPSQLGPTGLSRFFSEPSKVIDRGIVFDPAIAISELDGKTSIVEKDEKDEKDEEGFPWMQDQTRSSNHYGTLTAFKKEMNTTKIKSIKGIIDDHLRTELAQGQPSVLNLQDWCLQFCTEILAKQVYGLAYIPKDAFKIIGKVEHTMLDHQPPVRIGQRRIAFTDSQHSFQEVTDEYRNFARRLLLANRDHLLHNQKGYLWTLLENLSHKQKISPEKAFEQPEVQEILMRGLRLINNAGNVSKVLCTALIFLPTEPHKLSQSELKQFVEECLRYTSPVTSAMRFIKNPITLGNVDIAANTLVFIDFQKEQLNNKELDHPKRFDAKRTNNLSYSFFGKGDRMCPGMHVAKAIILNTVLSLGEQGVRVKLNNPGLRGDMSNKHWTLDDNLNHLRSEINTQFEFVSSDLTEEEFLIPSYSKGV